MLLGMPNHSKRLVCLCQRHIQHGFDGSSGRGLREWETPQEEEEGELGGRHAGQETWMGVRELASLNSLRSDDPQPESYTLHI